MIMVKEATLVLFYVMIGFFVGDGMVTNVLWCRWYLFEQHPANLQRGANIWVKSRGDIRKFTILMWSEMSTHRTKVLWVLQLLYNSSFLAHQLIPLWSTDSYPFEFIKKVGSIRSLTCLKILQKVSFYNVTIWVLK